MQKTSYLVLLLVSVLAQGCITMYKAPTELPTATVVFATEANGVRVQAYEDVTCKKSPYGNRLAYFFMNSADPHSGIAKEIAADKVFVYTFAADGQYAPCAVTTSFQPQAKQKYKAVFVGGINGCSATLYRVNGSLDEANSLTLEPSAEHTMVPCVNNLSD